MSDIAKKMIIYKLLKTFKFFDVTFFFSILSNKD